MEKVLEGKEKRNHDEKSKFTWNNYIYSAIQNSKIHQDLNQESFPLAQVPDH